MLRKFPVTIAALMLMGNLFAADKSDHVDFNFQIRPILSDRCFKCHGFDEKGRKANLRLDKSEGAFAVLDKTTNRRAIVPNNPRASELVRRITSTDPDEQMPPPDSKLSLSKDEITLLQKWVAQGAEYNGHWSFNPLKDTAVPKSRMRGASHPIDAFVRARLDRERLKPSAEASKETLIRRLALDLTGLPPTVKEIDRFVNDKSPNAYEKVVDY